MSELGMYFGIAVGCIALLGVCGGILYRKYQQEKQVKVAFEQQTQERLQQVAGTWQVTRIFKRLSFLNIC
jgi:hypothetical protein